MPYGDEWWTPGGQIVSFFHGTLQFADLFQQHNESRKLFPNLFYLLMAAVTGRWDVKDPMVLLFVMSGLLGTPLAEIFREVPVFVATMLVVLVVVTLFPDLVLWLPRVAGLMKQ